MKSIIFAAFMLITLASWQLNAHQSITSIDKVESVQNTQLDARLATAAFYSVNLTSVNVGTKIQYQGQEAWPFQVSSLNKSGLVINTPAGLIVDDELEGF